MWKQDPSLLERGNCWNVCRRCSSSYVGQTTRNLHTRISEHLGISPIIGKQSNNSAISSIIFHINASGHLANSDDFQILSSSSDSYELMIDESLLINKYKPNLNVQARKLYPSQPLLTCRSCYMCSQRPIPIIILPYLSLVIRNCPL